MQSGRKHVVRRLVLVAAAVLTAFGSSMLASARAEDDARARARAETWAKTLYKKDPIDRFLASWNLVALAPQSGEVLVSLLSAGKFGNDSLVSASQALGEIGATAAVAPLLDVVHNTRLPSDARIAALIAIAKAGGREGKDALAQVAGTEPESDATSQLIRCAALIAQGMRGDAIAIPLLEKALASEDAELRRAAFRAIGYARDRRFVPHCTKGLADEHPLVVAEAARSLGKINDPASADKLEALLKKQKNPAVRFLLVEALAWTGRKAALDELLACLEDPESHLQASSAAVLIDLGEKRALPVFRKLLGGGTQMEPGTDIRAAYALGALKDKDGAAVLVRALETGAIEVKREAAPALGALRAKEGVAALKVAARAKDRQLRALALVALGDVGDPSAGDDLASCLEDKDPVIRYAACVGLGLLGNRRAAPALKGLLQDDHDFVAAAAREAVARLEERPIAAADPRDPLVLTRLRALEREYVLRAQLGRLFQSYSTFVAQNAAAKADKFVNVIVGYETIIDSCGGAHPSTIRVPVTEMRKIIDRSNERARDQKRASQVEENDREKLDESYRLAKLRGDADAELRNRPGTGKAAK